MLALRIDFLNGSYHAADPAEHTAPEWPPHPERVFQALVAAAYALGADPTPLRDLEGLAAPELAFDDAWRAGSGCRFTAATWLEKEKQPPWSRSNVYKYDPVMVGIREPVYLIWADAADRLCAPLALIAEQVTYLGRAKTPVAVSVAVDIPVMAHRLRPSPIGDHFLRVPYAGRLAELDAAFDAGRRAAVVPVVSYDDVTDLIAPSPWRELLALRPDRAIGLPHAAPLADGLRAAVLSRAGDGASPLLHGHDGDHAAWAVIPDVGHRHARGHVLGVGLWLPRAIDDPARTDCVLPLMQVNRVNFAGRQVNLGMQPAHRPLPRGLLQKTWCAPCRRWASVTPMVLDRHPKGAQSVEDKVADSVEMAGYPRPLAVEVGPYSAFTGVPPAHEFHTRSRGRWLHVALLFGQRVDGPLLIGKDRHFGLGLLRPLADEPAP